MNSEVHTENSRNPSLLVDFNLLPILYSDISWHPNTLPFAPLFAKNYASRSERLAISSILLRHYKIHNTFARSLPEIILQVITVSPNLLRQATYLAGLLMCNQLITHAIEKKIQLAICQKIGKENYEFVLRRGQNFMTKISTLIASEKEKMQTRISSENIPNLNEHITLTGMKVFYASIHGLGVECRKRVQFLFPKSLESFGEINEGMIGGSATYLDLLQFSLAEARKKQ